MGYRNALQGISDSGVVGLILQGLEQGRSTGWPSSLGMYIRSDDAEENYKWLGTSPVMREWVGGLNAKGLRENGIDIKNKLFESTLAVGVDDLRRDKTGQLNIRISQLAQRANTHWASLVSDLIIDGETENSYDKVPFYSASHTDGGKDGTQSNLLTSSDFDSLNVATATAPTASEFADALLDVIGHFYSLKDDQGEYINEDAQSFTVMVGTTPLWSAARQAISSNQLETGSGTRSNPLMGQEFSVAVQYNPRISANSTKFEVFRTDSAAKPFILQEEYTPKLQVIGQDSEHAKKTREALYTVETSRNVGYAYWQKAIRATLS